MILNRSVNEIKGSAKLVKELADLYYNTFNERMKLGCGACYLKALIRLRSKLNKMESKEVKKESNFVLKVGSIREFGSSKSYDNHSLTDEVAIAYLKVNFNRLKQFSKYPKNIDELINPTVKVEEVKEEVKVDEVKKTRRPRKKK